MVFTMHNLNWWEDHGPNESIRSGVVHMKRRNITVTFLDFALTGDTQLSLSVPLLAWLPPHINEYLNRRRQRQIIETNGLGQTELRPSSKRGEQKKTFFLNSVHWTLRGNCPKMIFPMSGCQSLCQVGLCAIYCKHCSFKHRLPKAKLLAYSDFYEMSVVLHAWIRVRFWFIHFPLYFLTILTHLTCTLLSNNGKKTNYKLLVSVQTPQRILFSHSWHCSCSVGWAVLVMCAYRDTSV